LFFCFGKVELPVTLSSQRRHPHQPSDKLDWLLAFVALFKRARHLSWDQSKVETSVMLALLWHSRKVEINGSTFSHDFTLIRPCSDGLMSAVALYW